MECYVQFVSFILDLERALERLNTVNKIMQHQTPSVSAVRLLHETHNVSILLLLGSSFPGYEKMIKPLVF